MSRTKEPTVEAPVLRQEKVPQQEKVSRQGEAEGGGTLDSCPGNLDSEASL
jgi:hypothetical protein